MLNNIIKKICDFVISKYALILCLCLVLFICSLFAFVNLELKSNYIDLIPQKFSVVKKMRYLSKNIGGIGTFSLVLQTKKPNKANLKIFADLLYDDMKNWPEINYIEYKIPRQFFEKHFFLYMETEDLLEAKKRIFDKIDYEFSRLDPLFGGLLDEDPGLNLSDIMQKYEKQVNKFELGDPEYLITKDEKLLVFYTKPKHLPTDTDNTKIYKQKVEALVSKLQPENYGISVDYNGGYMLALDQRTAMANDISKTSVVALATIFLLLILFFRKIKYALFLTISLTLGILLTFTIAYFIYGHINLITGFLMAILTGLGVNYGIHFIFRYQEERFAQNDIKTALSTAFIKTGRPSLIGALTTSVAFLVLAFSTFKGFSEFGLLAGLGIPVILLSAYMTTSCLILLFERETKIKKITTGNIILPIHPQNPGMFSVILIVIGLIISIFLGFFAPGIKFEYSGEKLEVKDQRSIQVSKLIQEKFNTSTDPAVFFTFDREEEKDFYQAIKVLMQNPDSTIGNLISTTDIIPDIEKQKKNIQIAREIENELIIVEKSMVDEVTWDQINMMRNIIRNADIITENNIPEMFKRRFSYFIDNKPLYISQVFPKKLLFDTKSIIKYLDEVGNVKGNLRTYETTGVHVIYSILLQAIFSESRLFTFIVLFIIWLMVFIDLKKLKDSLLILIPLLFGLLWLLGIMAFFDLRFNYTNVIVLLIVIGAGVDNGVHIYHRYIDKGRKDIWQAVQYAGYAALAMSLTVAMGWSALFFASYRGLNTMASVGVIGITSTFIAATTLLPAITYLLNKNKQINVSQENRMEKTKK